MTATDVEAPDTAVPARRSVPWVRVVEVVALIGVTVVAFLVRRGGLPHDGLWFDDSWVASGAIHGNLFNVITVGSGHPAFTALLMGWHQLDHSLSGLAIPPLIAGTVTPALLYLSLRDARYERSVAALMAAAVAVAEIDIRYSTRVKPYSFDPVLILCLGLILQRLVKRRWSWLTVALWVAVSVTFGFFSGFLLLASAAAGIVVFLHPRDDRVKRGVAVGAQAACQLLLLRWAERSANLSDIEDTVQSIYDLHLKFHANPITFGSEILTHLRRIAELYPGGSGIWLTVFALAALAGLGVAALRRGRGPERIWCRYLLLMLAGSFIGALAGKFPFGPIVPNRWSSGGRYMLWAAPVFAFGLAAALHRLRRYALRWSVPRWAIDGAVLLAALVVLLAGIRTPRPAPFQGSASATQYADSVLQPGDVVIVTNSDVYSFSDSTDLPVTVKATPESEIGFTPIYHGADVHTLGNFGTEAFTTHRLRLLTKHAHRVVVVTGGGYLGVWLNPIRDTLTNLGFHIDEHRFTSQLVLVATH
jgi:hypothetical protein